MGQLIKPEEMGHHRVVHRSDGPAGRIGSRFSRILAGRVGSGHGQQFGFFSFLATYYFSVPESIWIFKYYDQIDWFSTIFVI